MNQIFNYFTLISVFKGLTDFALRVGPESGAGRYDLSQLQYVRVSDLRLLKNDVILKWSIGKAISFTFITNTCFYY
jgi:hypothetical protein